MANGARVSLSDLTEEQKALIYLIGKPDDGSEEYPIFDRDRVLRVTGELTALGLIYAYDYDQGKTHDLNDEGERVYDQMGGAGDYSILVLGSKPPATN